jgi:hypothetical protein
MVSRSIYNLKIDIIYMYDIPFDRSFLRLSNGLRHVMPSTDTKPELTAKASMAQPVSQPAVYANGLNTGDEVPFPLRSKPLCSLIRAVTDSNLGCSGSPELRIFVTFLSSAKGCRETKHYDRLTSITTHYS